MGRLRANVGALMATDFGGGGSNVFDLLNSAWDFGFNIGESLFGGRKQQRFTLPAWAAQGTPAYGDWSYAGVPAGKLVVIDKATGGHRVIGAKQGAGLALADLPQLPPGSVVTIDPKTTKRGVLNAAALKRALEGCPPPPPAPPPIVLRPPAEPPAIFGSGSLSGFSPQQPTQAGLARALGKGVLRDPYLGARPPPEGEECQPGFVESDGVCIPVEAPEPEQPNGQPPQQGAVPGCLPLCVGPGGGVRAQMPPGAAGAAPRPPRTPRPPRPINVTVRVDGCGCKPPRTRSSAR